MNAIQFLQWGDNNEKYEPVSFEYIVSIQNYILISTKGKDDEFYTEEKIGRYTTDKKTLNYGNVGFSWGIRKEFEGQLYKISIYRKFFSYFSIEEGDVKIIDVSKNTHLTELNVANTSSLETIYVSQKQMELLNTGQLSNWHKHSNTQYIVKQ
jgi:hypothetical protein